MNRDDEVLIIGAGLAGIFASLRMAAFGVPFVLVNSPRDASNSGLGGFAAFSGAKFSLLPAGEGLIGAAGGRQSLASTIDEVLAILSLPESALKKSQSCSLAISTGAASQENAWLKGYDSYVLSPDQIDDLLKRLTARLPTHSISNNSECISVSNSGNGVWSALIIDNVTQRVREVHAKSIIYAGGRANSQMLKNAGIPPSDGKGLDLGIRIEYMQKESLDALRALGPDAKVLRKPVRTFCLNYPGRIYYYTFENILLPGGVVEVDESPSANFAILNRVENKAQALEQCLATMDALGKQSLHFQYTSTGKLLADPALRNTLTSLFGETVSQNILAFIKSLAKMVLVPNHADQVVFLPLLDWHWEVFGPQDSFEAAPGLFVVGDASGKARGLLQACISGWMGGKECATSLN